MPGGGGRSGTKSDEREGRKSPLRRKVVKFLSLNIADFSFSCIQLLWQTLFNWKFAKKYPSFKEILLYKKVLRKLVKNVGHFVPFMMTNFENWTHSSHSWEKTWTPKNLISHCECKPVSQKLWRENDRQKQGCLKGLESKEDLVFVHVEKPSFQAQ